MSILLPAAFLSSVAVALIVCNRLARHQPLPAHRFAALDGLRGLLAFCVFFNHQIVWAGFLHGRGWHEPESDIYAHLGSTSVVLFFMTTAFLFVGKFIDARGGEIDWLRLYVSRVLRLAPAYWLTVTAMLIVLAIATHWQIDQAGTAIVLRGWGDIVSAALVWYSFCILGTPTIDGYMNTPMLVAGVTWSLAFEWAFYLVMPLLALPLLSIRRFASGALLVGAAGAVWLWLWSPATMFLWPFACGAVAAVLARIPTVRRWAPSPLAGATALAALLGAIGVSRSSYGVVPLLLLTIFFSLIASGNSLFGFLQIRATRWLGQVSYSLYLMHGLVVYVLWLFVVGSTRAAHLSDEAYWAWGALPVTVLVVIVAHLSFDRVERPALEAVERVTILLRWGGGWRSRRIASER